MITYRTARPEDLTSILSLFRQTVATVNVSHYTPEEIAAWLRKGKDPQRWKERIESQYFLISIVEGELAGFASLTDTGYLDTLFVHKDWLRRGIASGLLQQLEVQARSLCLTELQTDASLTALPFFVRHGFTQQEVLSVSIEDVSLTNIRMIKKL